MSTPSDPPDSELAARARGLLPRGAPEDAPGHLEALASLLAEWNQRMNLTGHGTAREILDALIGDAAGLAAALPRWEPETLADLGSGAGFPGLVLAILWPETRTVLVEARERRVHFQKAAVRALGMRKVEPLCGRAEQLEPLPSALVTVQAMGPTSTVLEIGRRWVAPGGWLVIPSSARVAEEAVSRGEPWEIRAYMHPVTGEERALLLHQPEAG